REGPAGSLEGHYGGESRYPEGAWGRGGSGVEQQAEGRLVGAQVQSAQECCESTVRALVCCGMQSLPSTLVFCVLQRIKASEHTKSAVCLYCLGIIQCTWVRGVSLDVSYQYAVIRLMYRLGLGLVLEPTPP
ncbi:unnamed protein product, partial [Discosporangium mesarthrocarpum]